MVLNLTYHALERLKERQNKNYTLINDKLIINESKWYSLKDFIYNSGFYNHILWRCRKSKELTYLTDGDIELIYNSGTGVVVTVLNVKDKFKPFTYYIKPELLNG